MSLHQNEAPLSLRRIQSVDDAHERFEVTSARQCGRCGGHGGTCNGCGGSGLETVAGIWVLAGEPGRATAQRMAAAAAPTPETVEALWRLYADSVALAAGHRYDIASGRAKEFVVAEACARRAETQAAALAALLVGTEPPGHSFYGGGAPWSRASCWHCGRGADAHLAWSLEQQLQERVVLERVHAAVSAANDLIAGDA